MTNKLFTPEQVANTLQVHHLTVLRMIKDKKLKSVKLGRVYRIRENDFNDFLNKNSTF